MLYDKSHDQVWVLTWGDMDRTHPTLQVSVCPVFAPGDEVPSELASVWVFGSKLSWTVAELWIKLQVKIRLHIEEYRAEETQG